MYVNLNKKDVILITWKRDDEQSFQSVPTMTYVLLTRDDDEKTIEFPTEPTFPAHLARIRQLVPDRSWQITEEWDR